ncbi:MAG: S-layer homology domain-containing protein, partial [Eubacteriales bacterium]|nr:S-layer homology domain-containing protein [Eubacteriales bacterium]
MKHLKKVLTAFVLSSRLISFNCVNAYATEFNDVKKEHWAYDYIQNMSDLGLLVGDLSGNFNPDSYISKFDTLKIIATLCGYNFNTKDLAEKEYYKSLNEKYKENIATYEKKYSKWNSSVSYEMSYLLEKGILNLSELDQFIVLNNEKEQLRALSREEIALYLVRIMGLEEEVNKITFTPSLKDHLDIAPDKINSVYYLQSLNIIAKDGENFYPKKAVTKAELSQIITNFLNYTKININVDNYQSSFSGNNIQTKFVTIEKIYPSDNIIQTKIGYITKTYKLAENSNIKINGKKASLNMISEGSYAEITFNNYLITDINVNTNVVNID